MQIRCYEGGVNQPAVDALKRLAIALRASVDTLLFDETERRPDGELRLQFEAVSAKAKKPAGAKRQAHATAHR